MVVQLKLCSMKATFMSLLHQKGADRDTQFDSLRKSFHKMMAEIADVEVGDFVSIEQREFWIQL